MAKTLHSLGAPRAGYAWGASAREVDMALPTAKPRPLRIAAAPQNVVIDLKRTAMVVIDMQNDFCAHGRLVDYLGVDVHARPHADRAAAEAPAGAAQGRRAGHLGQLGRPARSRQHAAQPAPSLQADRQRRRPVRAGAGQAARRCCRRTPGRPPWSTSWSRDPRTSWSTSTASAASGTRRSIRSCATSAPARCCSAGVNTDQCVLHSLTDANFLGYGCVMVEDCCAHHLARLLHRGDGLERQEVLRLRHRFGEDPARPEEVDKRLRDIVLLPGFMCDRDLWTDMVPGLEQLGRLHYGNVYEDDTLEGMARRVLAEAPGRFVLVGFSMGGFVARVLTLMAPERVSGVAFVASSARGYTDEEVERRKAGFRPGDRPPRASDSPTTALGLHPDRETDPVLLDRLRGMQRRLGREVRGAPGGAGAARRLRRPRADRLPVPGGRLPPGPAEDPGRDRAHGAVPCGRPLRRPRRVRPHGAPRTAERIDGTAGRMDRGVTTVAHEGIWGIVALERRARHAMSSGRGSPPCPKHNHSLQS